MTGSVVTAIAFYALAALAVVSAAWVAFARNIVHSAFALLGTFLGVAGLYALLAADLVAVVQLLVYVGGVLIVILFAVMLTSRITEVRITNRSTGVIPAGIAMAVLAGVLTYAALNFPRGGEPPVPVDGTTTAIGNALLGPYVLPFEVVSVVLLAALLGAVTLARGRGATPAPEARESAPHPNAAAAQAREGV